MSQLKRFPDKATSETDDTDTDDTDESDLNLSECSPKEKFKKCPLLGSVQYMEGTCVPQVEKKQRLSFTEQKPDIKNSASSLFTAVNLNKCGHGNTSVLHISPGILKSTVSIKKEVESRSSHNTCNMNSTNSDQERSKNMDHANSINLMQDSFIPGQSDICEYLSYSKLEEAIVSHEINSGFRYSMRQASKGFDEHSNVEAFLNTINDVNGIQILWTRHVGKDIRIEFNGTPFLYLNSRWYQCHHGKDSDFKKFYPKGKRKSQECKERKSKMSKKLDCPGCFTVKKVLIFPDYKVCADSIRSKREKQIIVLREALTHVIKANTTHSPTSFSMVKSVLKYLTKFPTKSDHTCHKFETVDSGLSQALDDRVRDFMKSLVHNGERGHMEIISLTLDFVNNTLLQGKPVPDHLRRRFVPSVKHVKNIIAGVLRKAQKVEQSEISNCFDDVSTSITKPLTNQETNPLMTVSATKKIDINKEPASFPSDKTKKKLAAMKPIRPESEQWPMSSERNLIKDRAFLTNRINVIEQEATGEIYTPVLLDNNVANDTSSDVTIRFLKANLRVMQKELDNMAANCREKVSKIGHLEEIIKQKEENETSMMKKNENLQILIENHKKTQEELRSKNADLEYELNSFKKVNGNGKHQTRRETGFT